MKQREKVLLGVFAVLFLLIIGGMILSFLLQTYRGTQVENVQLRRNIEKMRGVISQGGEWRKRSDWIAEHLPKFPSRQKASAHLLDAVQAKATDVKLTLGAKELLENPLPATEREQPQQSSFDSASVRIELKDAEEEALMTWLNSLQQPTTFIGVTRLELSPAPEGKKVNSEVELTLYFQELAPAH